MTRKSAKAGKWTIPLSVMLVALMALYAWVKHPSLLAPVDTPGPPRIVAPSQLYFGPANSIAILPFEAGPLPSERSFRATGFAIEVHRLLTLTPGLRVTSRNSSFFFQDSSLPLPVVAERLQVSHLLTGKLQTEEGRVTVQARLFNARKKEDSWSLEYEGGFEGLFEFEGELIAAVEESVGKTPRETPPAADPVDVAAWEFYLQGLDYQQQRTVDGLENAQSAFRNALDIEPEYELAWAGLAGTLLARAVAGDHELVGQAREALSSALEINPEFPAALALLSYVRRQYDWDWQGALEAAELAVSLHPGDPELMSVASLAMFSLGKFERGGNLLRVSVMQDPLNLARRLRLGLLQEFSGDYDQALTSYRQIIGLNPDFPAARAYRARVKILQEKPESALKESEKEPDPFWKRYSRILALNALERQEEAETLLQEMMLEDGQRAAYQVAEIFAHNGDIEAAFEWLERAREQKDGGMREVIGNRFLQNLHSDKRWQEMLGRLRLPLDMDR